MRGPARRLEPGRASARLAVLLVSLAATAALATPSGRRWLLDSCTSSASCAAGTTCTANHCVPVVRIAATLDNTGGSTLGGVQGLPYGTVITRTQDAFRNWTGARVAACATSWNVTWGGTFVSPNGTAAINASDGANSVIWLTGANWRHSPVTLGLTTTTFYTAANQIFDADTEMNNTMSWADNGEASSYDMESVVLHEAGHFLGLDHTTANAVAVMYPTVTPGEQKRALPAVDQNDVCAVYPGAPGAQGYPCTQTSTCASGLVCEGSPSGGQKLCTRDCAAVGDPCPQGYTCQPSSAGYACLGQVGATDLCRFCSSGTSCSTGVCLTDGLGVNWCSMPCQSAAQCGTGYQCQTLSIGSFCVPTAPCSNQCSGTTGCPVGYTCTSGTCRPTGAVGDRCEISAWCTACNACVYDAVDPRLAFCRACCGTGGDCGSCTNTSCGGGTQCLALTAGGRVCVPTTGAGLCSACGSGAPCQTGLSCTNARCHSRCEPSNAGTCTACLDLGAGNGGVCGCPDEVSNVNEPCGTGGTTLSICAVGLVCVSNPQPVCRATCNPADAASCPTGFSCQVVSGTGVCLPGAAGQLCSECTVQGTCGAGLTCYNNRCYTSCNVNSAVRCQTCVQTEASGVGVCACDDQIVGVNSPCGLPNIASCQPGTLCLNGYCRGTCDPVSTTLVCPALTECRALGALYYCQDFVTGGGSGGGSGGGTSGGTAGGGVVAGGAGGGQGGGKLTQEGCGCSAPGGAAWLLGLLVLGARRRR